MIPRTFLTASILLASCVGAEPEDRPDVDAPAPEGDDTPEIDPDLPELEDPVVPKDPTIDPAPLAVTVLGERLPQPLAGASAVTVGQRAFVFGGDTPSGPSDEILRFDPLLGEVHTMSSRLPQPSKITSAVTDGRFAYVIGGLWGEELSDHVVRFDPESDYVETMAVDLPTARGRTAAFFDGQAVYVVGGNTRSFVPDALLDEIVRIDLSARSSQILAERLPEPVASRIGAIWDGHAAYLIGGLVPGGRTDRVVRFRDGEGVRTMRGRLPFDGDGGAYALLEGRVFVLGGMTTSAPVIDSIVYFDPELDEVADAAVTLPSPRKGTVAATIGEVIYVFGGRTEASLLDEIVAVGRE